MALAIRSHRDLRVYQAARDAAMEVFRLSVGFPTEERFALTDQVRRSSRAVCANLAEAWRRRRYPAAFKNKITDAESEAEETRVRLEFAQHCGYLAEETVAALDGTYDVILSQLVRMVQTADKWAPD